MRTDRKEGPFELIISGSDEVISSNMVVTKVQTNLRMFERLFWRMALPIGKKMDHPFANPFGDESPNLELVKLDPILIMVGGDELMRDRVKLYADKLKELGKIVRYVEYEGKQHGFFSNEPYSDVSDPVLNLIKNFMLENSI